MIAYGIGGPALLLSQEKLATRFIAAPSARTTLVLFLIGVIAQVAVAVLYKTAMWYLYVGERSLEVKKRWTYKASDWISEAYLVETSFDLTSIFLFGVATFCLHKIMTG